MKIESLTISGFRCFGVKPQVISVTDFTCLIGPNASGKTSAMIALARLFGDSNSLRQVQHTDFHLTENEKLTDESERSLYIEAKVVFPELVDEKGDKSAVPEVFNQMIVDEPDKTPYCRIRLEATWQDSGTVTGEIEQKINWLLTSSEDLDEIETSKRAFKLRDRNLIHLIYIPANRNPSDQIKNASASHFGRLIQNIELNSQKENLETNLSGLRDGLSKLDGVKMLNMHVQQSWAKLYSGRIAKEVGFRAVDEEADSVIRLLAPYFMPSEDGRAMTTRDLSDGLRSLFSISLTLGFFRIESILRKNAEKNGFKKGVTEGLPYLSIFAVEEPENHLSPQYLGTVTSELKALSKESGVQVTISSHSPSILARVEPDTVRYFLGHEGRSCSEIRELNLPKEESDESYKYVREAVRGHPELYFAKLVILGEGPSEEIVLKRIFEANGMTLDGTFITVAPLGGRHVNHFWRLLNGLDIPYVTLLDLDREKEGAGWGRIQYVRDQLVALHGVDSNNLKLKTKPKETELFLSDKKFDDIYDRPVTDSKKMENFLKVYRNRYNVFFSAPLDLDFLMLECFSATYKSQAPSSGGPRLPDEVSASVEFNKAVIRRMKQVLSVDVDNASESCGETYTDDQKELFVWYKYLFVDGSKPVSHMRAMVELDDKKLTENTPEILQQLIARAKELTESI